MKKILIILLFIVHAQCHAQTCRIIHTPIFTSYFSDSLKEPLYVAYKLFKGGGSSSRAGMTFKSTHGAHTASAKDYSHSGYDEGHLADAQDFAFSPQWQDSSFQFINCLPQTANLNRGIWKHYETLIRSWSEKDSLLIECGGSEFKKIGRLYVPSYCWKAVISLSTGKLLFCGWFMNDSTATEKDILVDELENKLGYVLPLR